MLVSALGCGSRSLSADPDIYNPDETGDVIGATSGSGGAGSQPVPNGKGGSSKGGSGAGPSPTSNSSSACREYCRGYKSTCAELLGGRDCQASCTSEVDGSGPACQKLGIGALNCLAPYLTAPNRGCDATLTVAVSQCSEPLAQFQRCKPDLQPTPVPPEPTPVPPPMPSCSGSGGYIGTTNCKMSWTCADGGYTSTCDSNGDYYGCTCYWPTGMTRFLPIVPQPSETPCESAARTCGFAL